MNKVLIYITAFLLLLSVAHAESLYDYQTLDVNFSAASSVTLNSKQDTDGIDYVRARLFYFPKDNDYSISQVTTVPQAEHKSEELIYEWREPQIKRLEYSLESILTTSSNVPKITSRIPFPAVISAEYDDFTRPTTHIDSNNAKIKEQASRIVDGEDDLFVALFMLGSWVEKNIKYDLSTLTVETSQKASWVLENRVGVCDEMTSLFIAMVRSLGIPARFVTGISYTTHPAFEKNWMPHGWAEVYMPDIGWVPFDPTYKEFGYVDATHIKLSHSADPEQAATKFEWTGNGGLVPSSIVFDVEVMGKGVKTEPRVALKSELFRDEVSFNSYNVVRTFVTNNLNQYITASISASVPSEVVVAQPRQHIFLKPGEVKIIYWLLKVDDNLKDRYLYKFPIVISTEQDITEKIEFSAREHAVYIDQGQAELLIYEREKEEEQKGLTHNVEVECELKPQSVMINQTVNVNCNVRNLGNTILEKLQFCSDEDCRLLTIYIAEEKKAGFSFTKTEVGKYERVIRLNGMSNALHIPYEVLDNPAVRVKNIELPDKVAFKDNFTFIFSIERESYSIPQRVTIDVHGGGIRRVFALSNVSSPQEFSIESQAKYLKEGLSNITIDLEWQDTKGKIFGETINFPVVLEGLSPVQKLQNLLLRLALFIDEKFSQV